jgi:hypothetical protein
LNCRPWAQSIDVQHSAGQVLGVNAAVMTAATLSIGRPLTTPISMGGPRRTPGQIFSMAGNVT